MKKYLGFFILLIVYIPLVLSIRTFKISETESISLGTKVADPDNDNITIIYSKPLDSKGEWKTDYGDSGTYYVTISVSDGENTVNETVLLEVQKSEAPPVIISFKPDKKNVDVDEGKTLHFDVKASDPNKDNLTYVWTIDDVFASNSNYFEYAPSLQSQGSRKVAVSVSDGWLSTTKEWEILVNDVIIPPLFSEISKIEVNENEKIVLVLNASDYTGKSVEISSDNLPDGASINENTFTWTPSYNAVKKDSLSNIILDKLNILSKTFRVRFTARTNNSETQKTAVINVKDINRKPVLQDISPITVMEGEVVIINASSYDADGDKIIYSYSGWISSQYHRTTYGESGVYYVKVIASDSYLEDSKYVRINVLHKNRPPTIQKAYEVTAEEGKELRFMLGANDPDNEKLSFTLRNSPEGASVSGNYLVWTPDFEAFENFNGTSIFNVTVSDGKDKKDSQVKVRINNVNRKPEIKSFTPKEGHIAKSGEAVSFSVEAIDADNDNLSYIWDFGLFDKYDSGNSHNRIFSSSGSKRIKVSVNDGKSSVEHVWNIQVE